jgi:hypothetical protein
MKKYRIIERNGGYQIQDKFLFWWIDLYREDFSDKREAIHCLERHVRRKWRPKPYSLNVK